MADCWDPQSNPRTSFKTFVVRPGTRGVSPRRSPNSGCSRSGSRVTAHGQVRSAARASSSRAAVDELLDQHHLHFLWRSQGITRLAEKYGEVRLDAACQRALAFGNPQGRAGGWNATERSHRPVLCPAIVMRNVVHGF